MTHISLIDFNAATRPQWFAAAAFLLNNTMGASPDS